MTILTLLTDFFYQLQYFLTLSKESIKTLIFVDGLSGQRNLLAFSDALFVCVIKNFDLS